MQDDDILKSFTDTRDGLVYYNYELRSHRLISATIYQRRVYIMVIHGTALQWRRSYDKLLQTALSFYIPLRA